MIAELYAAATLFAGGIVLDVRLVTALAILPLSTVFGGIHFYTQHFERLDTTPGAFAVAGVIAIFAAWGLWRYNAL